MAQQPAKEPADLYKVVAYFEGVTEDADLTNAMPRVTNWFLVEKYKHNNPWQDVLELRQKQFGDAAKYTTAMERFLQLATKLLLERKAKGGEGNNWVNNLLVRIFDTETDPTLYNDKWENPAGKHRPAIQKGAPQMFAVTRDSFIEHRGLEVLAGAVQVKIDEIARLDESLSQRIKAAKDPDATPQTKAIATKTAEFMKKQRTKNVAMITMDVKLLIGAHAKMRASLTPLPPPAPDSSDSDEEGAPAAEPVLPPVPSVPGEEVLPRVARMVGDYIKRDAARLLNDLDAVMKLLYKVYAGLGRQTQASKEITVDVWKVLSLEALKGDVLVARIAALDKLIDLKNIWEDAEAFNGWVQAEGIIPLVLGERMPADKDGYVKAARDLLQNMEHTAETFVPLLDKMILPKLSAEFVQQHLIIDLCLNDKDFPDELWKVVLSRLEGLVRRNDTAGLALTQKLFTATSISKAIDNQPEAVGETLHFLRVTLDHWTALAGAGDRHAESRREQLVYCYSEAWEQIGPDDAAEKLRIPLSLDIATEIQEAVVAGGALPERLPVQMELLKAQLDALRPKIVAPATPAYGTGGTIPSKEQAEADWIQSQKDALARRDAFVMTLNALGSTGGEGRSLVDLLLDEVHSYCGAASGEARVEGARARLALVERMHRCAEGLVMGKPQLESVLSLVNSYSEPPMEAMVYAWLRTAFAHAPTVKYDKPGQLCYGCFAQPLQHELLGYLQLQSKRDAGLSVQAYFLFQNLLIAVNAAEDALRFSSFEGHPAAPHGFYGASAARPAGSSATWIELSEQQDRQNVSRIVANSDAGEFDVYGQARHRPKSLDGQKMVGRWLKIRQEDLNQHQEPTGVWKDGVLSRFYPGGWQQQTRFDIVYLDGSHTNNSLRQLHSWFLIDALEEQLPVIPDIYQVDESRLEGMDGLWAAAVVAEDADVARLAQQLLLKLESTAMAHRTLARTSSGGQSQLTQKVKAGLSSSLEAGQGVHIQRYVDILQLFVERYRGNASRRAHSRGVRGAAMTVHCVVGAGREGRVTLGGVHAHTTAAALYARVEGMAAAAPPVGQAEPLPEAFLLRHRAGLLPRGSCQTLHELGLRTGVVLEKIPQPEEEMETPGPKPCPGDALAGEPSWFELLGALLAKATLPQGVGEAVWRLLNSVATFGSELDRINTLGFEFDAHASGGFDFVRVVYSLHILEAQIQPAAAGEAAASVRDWRAGELVVTDLADFVRFALELGSDADPPRGFAAAAAVPLTLEILRRCVEATCSEGGAGAEAEAAEGGLLGELSAQGLAALRASLLGEDGSGVELLQALVALLRRCDALATEAAAECGTGGSAPSIDATERFDRLGAAAQHGAEALVALLQTSDTLRVQFLNSAELMNVASLLFQSPNDTVRRGVRIALREISRSSAEAGTAVFGLCVSEWRAGLPPAIDSTQFFGLLSDLNTTTPAVRSELLAMFVEHLLAMAPATERLAVGDTQQPLLHALQLVAALLRAMGIDAGPQPPPMEGGEAAPPPLLATHAGSLMELEQRLFQRFVFTVPIEPFGVPSGLPICQAPAARAAACQVLEALCELGDGRMREMLVHELISFVTHTDPPQNYNGFPDFNCDMTDDYSTPYKLRNMTGRAGITNQGMTCYMNASLQQMFHIPEARHAVLNCISGVRIQITNSADVLMRDPKTETEPPECEISINGRPFTPPGKGIRYNASTELSEPMAPGVFRIDFKVPARPGLEWCFEGLELTRCGNFSFELTGNTTDDFRLQNPPKGSAELLPQLRRAFYFLEQGNAATYDSSKFCDACESMSMFAEWTDNRVRQQCCAGEYFLALMDAVKDGVKGLPCEAELKKVGTLWETTKFCHKCGQTSPANPEWQSVNALTTFTEDKKLGSLAACMEHPTQPEGPYDGKGDNPLLSPWCKHCGDGDDDERTVTTKWSSIKTPPNVLSVHLKRVATTWDDWGGMRQEKKNHRIEFPMRFDLAPYLSEAVRAKHVSRIQKEMDAAAAGGEGEGGEQEGGALPSGPSLGPSGIVESPPIDGPEGADGEAGEEQAGQAGEEGPEPVWYSFLGAIIHSGVAGGGHYVSIVKQPDGKFVLFDDNEAIPFDPAHIPDYCFGGEADEGGRGGGRERTKNAYMLLYRREQPEPEPEQEEREPEPEPETEPPPVDGAADIEGLSHAAMREMEHELQIENLRLLRRERLYQPAVMKLFYGICHGYVIYHEEARVSEEEWREQQQAALPEEQREDFAPYDAGDFAAKIMELACLCFLRIVVRAKHGHAQIKAWLENVSFPSSRIQNVL